MLMTLYTEMSAVSVELQSMSVERDHWRSLYDCATAELNASRKAQFEEASRVNELSAQLTQQTEYCANMGAACATLLWRVSRNDDAVQSLLTGVSNSNSNSKNQIFIAPYASYRGAERPSLTALLYTQGAPPH